MFTTETQELQRPYYFTNPHLHTKKPLNLSSGQQYRFDLPLAGVNINHPLSHLAASQFQHQFGRPLECHHWQVSTEPFLKTQRGFTAQSEVYAPPMNSCLIEIRRFYQNTGSISCYLSIQTSHNAGNGNHPFLVSNDQHVLAESPLDSIQSSYGFAFLCPAYYDPLSMDSMVIEGMEGLPIFQHHIVSNIDNITDRPHATSQQTLL